MGLFQDQTSSLSEIKRLAALVTDPSRREEIEFGSMASVP